MGFESGARAALKDAIVARDAAADRVEGAKSGLARIEDETFAAHRRLREARTAASEEEAERVQAIVAGGAATLLERINGRASEADIEREIVSLKSARDLCRTALADAETDLGWKERKVVSAIGAVLAGSASRLIAEEEQLRASLESRRAILRYLRSALPDAQTREIDRRLPAGFADDAHPAVLPWKAAAEELSENAEALLPDA
jgi:chromosome segregation ATPase